jgi:hypothetical protein
MKKKTRGFGLGSKNRGERKRDEPPKKKVPTVTSNWGTKKAKTKETAERSPGRHQPSYEIREIEIADITIGEKRRSLNGEKLHDLMQSISVLGLQTPITVRSVQQDAGWGKTRTEWHLVTGFHRLEAMKRLGEMKIPCFVMKGDERDARKWEISENLHRAELTPLEYDVQVAEWVRLTESDAPISGHNVQKRVEAAGREASRRRRVGCRSKVRPTQRSARTSSVRLRSTAFFRKPKKLRKRRDWITTARNSSRSQPKKHLRHSWQKSESSNKVHARRNRRPRKLMRRHRSRLRTKRSSNTFSRIGMMPLI